jgi:hypothetical protein
MKQSKKIPVLNITGLEFGGDKEHDNLIIRFMGGTDGYLHIRLPAKTSSMQKLKLIHEYVNEIRKENGRVCIKPQQIAALRYWENNGDQKAKPTQSTNDFEVNLKKHCAAESLRIAIDVHGNKNAMSFQERLAKAPKKKT